MLAAMQAEQQMQPPLLPVQQLLQVQPEQQQGLQRELGSPTLAPRAKASSAAPQQAQQQQGEQAQQQVQQAQQAQQQEAVPAQQEQQVEQAQRAQHQKAQQQETGPAQRSQARLGLVADGAYHVVASAGLLDALNACADSLDALACQVQLACCDQDGEGMEVVAAPPPAAPSAAAAEQLLGSARLLLLAGAAAGDTPTAPSSKPVIGYVGGQKVLAITAAPLLDAVHGQRCYAAAAAALAPRLASASGWELRAEAGSGRLVLLRGPQQELLGLLQELGRAL